MNYQSLNIMRTNLGWAVVCIKENSTTPEIHNFKTWEEVRQWLNSLSQG